MLTVYLLLLIARMVIQLVMTLSRTFQPDGALVLVFESVFTSTDPPLRLLRKFIPPLTLGKIQLDLGFLLLFIVIVVLRSYAQQL